MIKDKPKYKCKHISENGKSTIVCSSLYNVHYAAINEYCRPYIGGTYLEIGTNYGHSAFRAWTAFQPRKIVLCDLFSDRRMIPFIQRVFEVIDCTANITFLIGNTHKTLKHIKEKFDVILVDGDHTDKGARQDLLFAWEHLNKGGVLLFDDINIDRLCAVFDRFCMDIEKEIEYKKKHCEWKEGVGVIKRRV